MYGQCINDPSSSMSNTIRWLSYFFLQPQNEHPRQHTQLHKAPRGNDLMNQISDKIKSGARAFLKTEYKYLAIYTIVVFAVLLILYTLDPPSSDKTDGIRYAASFLCGATLSATAGWGGMAVATDANVRTTQAAKDKGLAVALRVAFTGGAVMGFTVVGLGLLGLSVMYLAITYGYTNTDIDEITLQNRLDLAADGIALFARVAGGIYTKAADVGADLVGKVEMDIPEDDPRNPAVIADNVGDNVGDVAGMGADLFESFVRKKIVYGCSVMSFFFAWSISRLARAIVYFRFTIVLTHIHNRSEASLLPLPWPMATLRSSCCRCGLPVAALSPVLLAFSLSAPKMALRKRI
jgi:Na+/H+-translocating membrane pyrophosphatase